VGTKYWLRQSNQAGRACAGVVEAADGAGDGDDDELGVGVVVVAPAVAAGASLACLVSTRLDDTGAVVSVSVSVKDSNALSITHEKWIGHVRVLL
jgi:hypothetical protein